MSQGMWLEWLTSTRGNLKEAALSLNQFLRAAWRTIAVLHGLVTDWISNKKQGASCWGTMCNQCSIQNLQYLLWKLCEKEELPKTNWKDTLDLVLFNHLCCVEKSLDEDIVIIKWEEYPPRTRRFRWQSAIDATKDSLCASGGHRNADLLLSEWDLLVKCSNVFHWDLTWLVLWWFCWSHTCKLEHSLSQEMVLPATAPDLGTWRHSSSGSGHIHHWFCVTVLMVWWFLDDNACTSTIIYMIKRC